jgi:hypothetical protein
MELEITDILSIRIALQHEIESLQETVNTGFASDYTKRLLIEHQELLARFNYNTVVRVGTYSEVYA